ncbi:MAG: sensor histidine kinase [Oscillospiraceae bacterium]
MKVKENLLLKVLAFLLAMAAFTGAALMGLYQIANFVPIWGDGTPADGYTISYLERQDCNTLKNLLILYRQEDQGEQLDTYAAQWKASWESALSAENTNLRWQVRDSTGAFRCGNTRGEIPVPAEGLYLSDFSWWEPITFTTEGTSGDWKSAAEGAVNVTDTDNVVYSDDWQNDLQETAVGCAEGWLALSEAELDAVYLDENGITDLLIITDNQGKHVYGPTVRSYLSANEYGYQYDWGGWHQVEEPGGLTEKLDITMWLAAGYPVADKYQQAYNALRYWESNRELLLAATIACAVAGVLLAVYLCAGAGHKRGVEGIHLNWFHRIPGDLLLAAVVLGVVLAVCTLAERLCYSYTYTYRPMWVLLMMTGALAACVVTLALAFVVTFAARVKARTLFHSTLIAMLCRAIVRLCRAIRRGVMQAFHTLPMTGRAVLLFLAYLLGTVLTSATIVLIPIYQGFVLYLICRWVLQWKRIRAATQDIVSGKPDVKIEAGKFYPDLKEHAGQLNDLGSAIDHAVDERMKSERFKTELITNVSHDLKTPLTSIINYVDLLKKEDIPNPAAQEYIEVLDRKSQRLKKLTEDLVEASKASTGALTVNKERLDVVQLIRQATGEYEEKLTAAGLTLVLQLPDAPVYIDADGRHVWRVLDNLLGNCAKYALEGTRVYLDAVAWDGNAVITVKNVSRQPLNIPAEQLVERFVRGDESRTTEGSGLGLSIARSLTELQGGRFLLDIDGDLFKAKVMFPLAQE